MHASHQSNVISNDISLCECVPEYRLHLHLHLQITIQPNEQTAFVAENRTRKSVKIRPLSSISQYVNERFSMIRYASQTEWSIDFRLFNTSMVYGLSNQSDHSMYVQM